MGCHFLLQCMKVKSESEVAQSRPTLSDPMDCSLPGSSIHGISRQEYWSGVPLPSLYHREEWPKSSLFNSYSTRSVGFQKVALVVKDLPANTGDTREAGVIHGRIWQPTPVFLPGNSMDRGGWRTIVQGAAKSQTQLKDWALPEMWW